MRTVARVTRAMATGSASCDGRSPASRKRNGIDRERSLIVRQSGPARVDEAVAVEHDDGRGRCAWIHALGDELALQHGRDADGRRACTDEQEAVGRQTPATPASGEQAGQDDRPGPLDVVVEARQAMPVGVEDPHRVVLLEVLPLEDGRREDPGHCPRRTPRRPRRTPRHATSGDR